VLRMDDHLPDEDDKRFGASEKQGESTPSGVEQAGQRHPIPMLLDRHFVIHREEGGGRCGLSARWQFATRYDHSDA